MGFSCTKLLDISFSSILNSETCCVCFIMDIPPHPNQPKTFPMCSFGAKNPVKRNFQPSWFKERSWLHYEETNNFVFCHL